MMKDFSESPERDLEKIFSTHCCQCKFSSSRKTFYEGCYFLLNSSRELQLLQIEREMVFIEVIKSCIKYSRDDLIFSWKMKNLWIRWHWKKGNWGSERLSKLTKVTQLICDRGKMPTQLSQAEKPTVLSWSPVRSANTDWVPQTTPQLLKALPTWSKIKRGKVHLRAISPHMVPSVSYLHHLTWPVEPGSRLLLSEVLLLMQKIKKTNKQKLEHIRKEVPVVEREWRRALLLRRTPFHNYHCFTTFPSIS